MRCISTAYADMRCPSARVSVMFVSCVKTNKNIFEIFSPSGSPAILVFRHQTRWRYSDGNPPNGGVECRWGRQKRDSGRISGFAAYMSKCYQPYESRNVKNKATTNGGKCRAEHSRRRLSSVVRTRRRRSVLVITPFSAAVGHHGTEIGGYFC